MSWKRILYGGLILLVAIVAGVLGAAAGGWAVYRVVNQRLDGNPSADGSGSAVTALPASSSAQSLVVNMTDVETTITQVVDQVGPAVVTVVGVVPGQMSFFGRTAESEVSGSGVFISDQGYILTNNHVVEGASELWAVLSDGSQQAATLVGTDQYADLAVLKTDGPVPAVATLGDSDALDPGETVIAIGSPLGDFKNSVTVGVVSATGRSIDTGKGYLIEGLIQTDAAINQGNSGGPLVNLAGEVVGVNTLMVRSSGSGTVAEGLGFAIPAKTIQTVAGQIMATGRYARPYVGIEGEAVTPAIARMYRLPVQWGIYVTQVAAGSPASEAGIQRGDILTRVGEVELNETNTYLNALFTYRPGDKVKLGLNRDGRALEVEITLGEV